MKMNPMSPYVVNRPVGEYDSYSMINPWFMFLWVIASMREDGTSMLGESIDDYSIHYVCCGAA